MREREKKGKNKWRNKVEKWDRLRRFEMIKMVKENANKKDGTGCTVEQTKRREPEQKRL